MKLGFIGTGNMAGRNHRFGYFGSREGKGTFSLWNLCDR